ncbi:MAG: PTS glucitol/sorbitol transporter subunit IIB [Thermoanaerobacter sp.]|jgi:PTS system glucitol/sorbitol-specific IIC component|nr:PTS glucitol/sorbitol transporter subunit IIB [Thermoanaerobacter sp.]
MYRAVIIKKGSNGWGGPLIIKPTEKKNKIASITGGGIHPIAQRIAELTGGVAIDGFRNPVPEDEICCVVIDCGGTARAGVYPKKRIPTINLTPVGPTGPLADYIVEDIYVSGVRENDISLADESENNISNIPIISGESKKETFTPTPEIKHNGSPKGNILERFGRAMGGIVGTLYQAGRKTIDQLLRNIIPFMAFVATIIGIINATGIGKALANLIAPLANNIVGLLIISIIAGFPLLSPLLGPGAVIAQVIGVLLGVEIGKGTIPPQFALPALFAIDPQVGCDFIPVGLSLGEAKPETNSIGVSAILISRLFTGPIAVLIAYLFSFGLY